ncbi:MAG: sulfatase, partial [Saprospirales bacterium TMED214]
MPRRRFLNSFGMGMGALGLSSLLSGETPTAEAASVSGGALSGTHHVAKAKRVIFLFQSGGPSQIDLLDHKPHLNKVHGQQLPDSVRQGQRLTGMSGNQSSLPLVGSPFKFAQHGESGQW